MNMNIKVATNIKTEIFYSVPAFLKKNGWLLAAEYDSRLFDKGIDFDLYQFTKKEQMILMAWNNWFEGEIKAEMKTLMEIAMNFNINLSFGEPEYLSRPNIIEEMKTVLKFKK
ncbi:hypothetical protein [Niabella beijingensis]|uniref:hypothetical protein n=1 Tax=Niabella beijingensis TaxID=2872700 RepID=UPI001CBE1E22|nr:hypothetical protein [Niabella beijingensis]MBZ4190649.1 hypothetical protein [Niabella beijingensis]